MHRSVRRVFGLCLCCCSFIHVYHERWCRLHVANTSTASLQCNSLVCFFPERVVDGAVLPHCGHAAIDKRHDHIAAALCLSFRLGNSAPSRRARKVLYSYGVPSKRRRHAHVRKAQSPVSTQSHTLISSYRYDDVSHSDNCKDSSAPPSSSLPLPVPARRSNVFARQRRCPRGDK